MKFAYNARTDLCEPDRKRRLTHGLFTLLAPAYDRINPLLSLGRDRSWKQALVRALPDLAQPCCLDLACGTGDLAFLLARRYPAGRILGLDLAEKMLELARRRNTHPHVSFVCADMTHTGQATAGVDIVTGGYALRNAPDLAAVLDEIARILKPGGVAAFLDFSKPASRPMQRLFYVLLRAWGGFWGWVLQGQPALYTYIADSLRIYPDRPTLHRLLAARGLTVLQSRLHYAGMLETLLVRKAA